MTSIYSRGAVARPLGRRFVLIDHSPDALEVMRRRLEGTLC